MECMKCGKAEGKPFFCADCVKCPHDKVGVCHFTKDFMNCQFYHKEFCNTDSLESDSSFYCYEFYADADYGHS